MIYGTVAPVIAGCLLTAVPNETSTLGLAAMNGLIHRGLASSDAAKMRTGTWGAVYLIVGLMRVISGGGVRHSSLAMRFERKALRSRSSAIAESDPVLFARQSGCRFQKTPDAPMLWVFHRGHVWLASRFAFLGFSNTFGIGIGAAALHAVSAGAMGTLILEMMPRVALGYYGGPIDASRITVVMFWCVVVGALLRTLGAAGAVEDYLLSLLLGGLICTAAWFLVTLSYWRVLVPRNNLAG